MLLRFVLPTKPLGAGSQGCCWFSLGAAPVPGLAAKGCASSRLGQATAARAGQPEIVLCSWSASICAQRAGAAGDDLVCGLHVPVETHGLLQGQEGCVCCGYSTHPWGPRASSSAPGDQSERLVQGGLSPLKPSQPWSRL